MKNILEELRKGNVVIGTSVMIENAQIVELTGCAGWDYIMINVEDSALPTAGMGLDNLARAARAADVAVMLKLLRPDLGMIYKALNMGYNILHVSISKPEELEMALKATKYPMENGGRIGCGTIAGTKYGIEPFNDYYSHANNDNTICPIFETIEGVENMEAILSVEGLEIVTFGPFDLALCLGGLGKPEVTEKVEAYWKKLIKLCKAKGIHVSRAMHDYDRISQVNEWIDAGVKCILAAGDAALLAKGNVKWVKGLRAEINKR